MESVEPPTTELSADMSCDAGAALEGVRVGFRDEGRLLEGSVESLGRLGDEAREESASKRLTTVGISGLVAGRARCKDSGEWAACYLY